ncbi:MAG: polysaccharide biosynthesis/export family protein [Bryobacteraceae bacterium]|nr:polysaccharide biosynthesis/export family protein [Bryobacteraceae bacterium]
MHQLRSASHMRCGARFTRLRRLIALLAVYSFLAPSTSFAQAPRSQGQRPASSGEQSAVAVRPDYVLGPNDQILIRATGVPEINDQPFRIDAEGQLDLPTIGKVQAAGQTIQNLENEITKRLREFVREPQVYISLVQFRSEPVFFVGDFRNPGVYPLQGSRTLVEMLTAVGGILPSAGRRIRITRRNEYGKIPLAQAIEDREKQLGYVDISLESLTRNVNPEEDIVLQPYDIISAEAAEKVFVIGEVTRGASLELGQRQSIPISQALTEAGGLTPLASLEKVRVLRPITGTNQRAEILIDLREVLMGRRGDFPLLPNDVVYVPRSGGRAMMATMATGLVGSIPFIVVSAFLRR